MLSDTAIAIFVAAPLYAVTTFVLAYGAYTWARAIRKVHEARHAQVQADVTQGAYEAAGDIDKRVAGRAAYVAPTEDDLRAAILMERAAAELDQAPNPPEHTTDGNDGIPEQPPIPAGGLYRDR